MKFLYGILIALMLAQATYSKDFGAMGPTYPIMEINFLDFIYQQLKTKAKTGELRAIQIKMQNDIVKSTLRPRGVDLLPATTNRTRLFDPSLTLNKDIRTHDGKLIAIRGTKINPLAYRALSKELVFINSDNKQELEFARVKLQENPNNKIILVNGNVKDANIYLGTAVYFDQAARLVTRFNLKYTPSVIKQEHLMLKITEVAL